MFDTNELSIFKNAEFGEIRTVTINNEVWFVAKDVAVCLGYKNTNKAIKDHCKKAIMTWGNDSLGRKQEYKVIPEGDVYRLIARSKLPSAEEFESWVFDDVIVQIRKTGGYIPVKEEDTNEEIMAKAYLIATETLKRKTELIEKLQPMADIAETRIDKKGCMSITDVTKSLGFKRGQITRWAKAKGYLHMTLNEVNKSGEKYFKVYSSDGVHSQVGVLEEGVHLISEHKKEIMEFSK